MSNFYTNLVPCPDIQDRLDALFLAYDSSTLRDETPFFDFLLTTNNREGINAKVSPGKGKLMSVDLTYEERLLATATTNLATTTRSCTATTVRGNKVASYELDPAQVLQTEELLAEADFTYMCENIDTIVSRKIAKLVSGHMLAVAKAMTTQASLLLSPRWSSDISDATATTMGAVEDFTSGISIDYLKIFTRLSGGITPDPSGWAFLQKALMQTNYGNVSPIFTTGEMYDYAQLMRSGCCATTGIDLLAIQNQYGIAVAYDRLVGSVIDTATTDAWILRPGALQVINYTRNDNGLSEAAGVRVGASYQKQVIFDPRTGYKMDLTISETCSGVSVIVESVPKVVAMPTDMFNTSDHMAYNTFFNGIRTASRA